MNLPVLKMTNNVIFHHISATVRETKECYGTLEQDRNLYRRYKKDGTSSTN